MLLKHHRGNIDYLVACRLATYGTCRELCRDESCWSSYSIGCLMAHNYFDVGSLCVSGWTVGALRSVKGRFT